MSHYKLILKDAKEATISGRQNLKIKFQQELGIPESSVENLFSSLPAILEENLEQDKADKYFAIFEQLGADVELELEEDKINFSKEESYDNLNLNEKQSLDDRMFQMDSVITDATDAASSVSAISSLGSNSNTIETFSKKLNENKSNGSEEDYSQTNDDLLFTPQEESNEVNSDVDEPSALELATMPSDEEIENEIENKKEIKDPASDPANVVLDSFIKREVKNKNLALNDDTNEEFSTSNEESLTYGSQEKINMSIFEEEDAGKEAKENQSKVELILEKESDDTLILSEPGNKNDILSEKLSDLKLSNEEEIASSENFYEEFEEISSISKDSNDDSSLEIEDLGLKSTALAAGAALTGSLVNKETKSEVTKENSGELEKLSKELEEQFSLFKDKNDTEKEEKLEKKESSNSKMSSLEKNTEETSKDEILGKINLELQEIDEKQKSNSLETISSKESADLKNHSKKEADLEKDTNKFDISTLAFEESESEELEEIEIPEEKIKKAYNKSINEELDQDNKEKENKKLTNDSLLSELEANLGELDGEDIKTDQKTADKKSLTKSLSPTIKEVEESEDIKESSDNLASHSSKDKMEIDDELIFKNIKDNLDSEEEDLSFNNTQDSDLVNSEEVESKESEIEIKQKRKRAPSSAFFRNEDTIDVKDELDSSRLDIDSHSLETTSNEYHNAPNKKSIIGLWALILLSLGTLIGTLAYVGLSYFNQQNDGAIDKKIAELIIQKNITFRKEQAAKNKKAKKAGEKVEVAKLLYEAISVNEDLSFKMSLEADNESYKIKTLDILIKQQSSEELTPLEISNDKKRKPWLRRFEVNIVQDPLKKGDIAPKAIVKKSYAYIDDGIKAKRTPATLTIKPEISGDSGEIIGTWSLRSEGAEDYDKGKIKTISGPSSDSYEIYFEGNFLAEKVK